MDNTKAMSNIIRKIIELKGNAVFGNSKLFCAMIDDMVPELAKERKIFRRVLDDKILAEIGRLYDDAFAQKSIGLERIRQKLMEDYGFQKEWCDIVIDSFSGSAAEPEDGESQNKLGLMYYSNKDYVKAYEWFKKAAEQGDSKAQNNLGRMYEKGYGTKKNFDEALKWFKKAAEQGDSKAQNNLGRMYEKGYGTKKNFDEALKWYKKAAEQGNTSGQRNLRRILLSRIFRLC